MRLLGVLGVGVVMGGAVLASAQNVRHPDERTGKQYSFSNRQQQGNYGNSNAQQRQNHGNNGQQQQGYSSNSNNQQQQQYNADYNTLLQQYAALASANTNSNTGYYDTYANSVADYTADAYLPAATYASTAVSENPDSSPALSALALLGFLYFLNLIQDVLQNNNGRRKRSADLPQESDESFYSTTYLEDPHIIPEEPQDKTPSFLQQELGEEEEEVEEEEEAALRSEEEESPYSPRTFSFLEDFFIKLPQALGISRKHPQIERDGRDEKPMDVGGYITSRIKMISSIMSFLQDPSPTRVRRAIQNEASSSPIRDSILTAASIILGNDDSYQEIEDSEEDRDKADQDAEDSIGSRIAKRIRRFTHSMNAWYDELGGRNYEPDKSSNMAAKMTSYLGGGRTMQDAMSKDAVPTFLEFTKSLDGRHPHCLQRALCRINSHTHGSSFFPKLAIQFLSSQLAGSTASDGLEKANQRAMAAGREGLNCESEFPDCLSVVTSTTPPTKEDRR